MDAVHALNGPSVWSASGNTHAALDGLENLYYEGGKLKSRFYPDGEIHILSFTFHTLNVLCETDEFKKISEI